MTVQSGQCARRGAVVGWCKSGDEARMRHGLLYTQSRVNGAGSSGNIQRSMVRAPRSLVLMTS